MTQPLVLKNIRKSYQDGSEQRQILDGIDLVLEKGELVAILGPSGSGKSTLLSIIGCLLSADEGELIIDGQSISSSSKKSGHVFDATIWGSSSKIISCYPT